MVFFLLNFSYFWNMTLPVLNCSTFYATFLLVGSSKLVVAAVMLLDYHSQILTLSTVCTPLAAERSTLPSNVNASGNKKTYPFLQLCLWERLPCFWQSEGRYSSADSDSGVSIFSILMFNVGLRAGSPELVHLKKKKKNKTKTKQFIRNPMYHLVLGYDFSSSVQ